MCEKCISYNNFIFLIYLAIITLTLSRIVTSTSDIFIAFLSRFLTARAELAELLWNLHQQCETPGAQRDVNEHSLMIIYTILFLSYWSVLHPVYWITIVSCDGSTALQDTQPYPRNPSSNLVAGNPGIQRFLGDERNCYDFVFFR